MLGRKLLFLQVLVLILLSASASRTFAVTAPTFPSCVNPQGTQKVSYSQGTHGVPGNTNSYTGSDSVYTLSDATLLQCLCTSTGAGIQTNWWKVSSLTQDEIAVLVSQGWTQVPDGSVWGLDQAPYLAQNSSFACFPGTGGPGVLGASTGDVLGLATTGNALFILSVILSGVTFLGFGAILNKIKK